MKGIDVDGDLIRWTELFMSDKGLSLVIDGYQCTEAGTDRSTTGFTSITHSFCNISECNFQGDAKRGGEMHDNIIHR